MVKKFVAVTVGIVTLFIITLIVVTYNFFTDKLEEIQGLFQSYQYNLVMQERRDLVNVINSVLEKRYRNLQEQLVERKILEIKANLKALNRLITLDNKITKQVIDTFFLSNPNLDGYAVKDGIIISSTSLMDLGRRGFIPCDPTKSILHQCEKIVNGYYYFVIYNPKYDLYLVGYTQEKIKNEVIKEELIRILKSFPNVIVAPKEVIQSQKDIVYREFQPFHIFYGIKINRQEIHQLVENAMLPIRSYFKALFLQYTLWALIGGIFIMVLFYLFMIKRADQLERFFKETEMKALKDPMTSLYNRSGFSKLYQESMKGKCALVLVDLDNFKYINDKFGHEKGDEVLKFFSNLLRSYFPDSLIGRWGGDEFIICTRQPIKEVKNRLYNIQKALRDFQESFDSEMEKLLSISGGVCADRDLSYEEKFKKADLALYKSKKKGKGLILLYKELDYVRMEKEDLK